MIVNILQFIHRKTNIAGCPFGFFKAFNILLDKRFSLKKKIKILKYRQIVNLHSFVGRLLYSSSIWFRKYPTKFKKIKKNEQSKNS